MVSKTKPCKISKHLYKYWPIKFKHYIFPEEYLYVLSNSIYQCNLSFGLCFKCNFPLNSLNSFNNIS